KFARPRRRDDASALILAADRAGPTDQPRSSRGPLLVLACILRDQVQGHLAELTHRPDPLFTMPEAELVAQVSTAHGTDAGVALARVYRRLRALPSRSQAAAPWSSGTVPRRDFESLYRDVAELCRTLGHALDEA
ncbi:MAG TPA: hypothetical protein VH143_12545, partial [Kofleriaceae bacterium]|nr:hypothetical protein [Kofleriaceae bacterium]